MKSKIFFLVLCIFVTVTPKPVGLANCGNTCFMNAFLQILYQIDPIVDILTLPEAPKFYKQDSLGYYLQPLIMQIKSYESTNFQSPVDCKPGGPLYNFVQKGYQCIGVDVGNPGDASLILSNTFESLVLSKNAQDASAKWRYKLIDAVKIELSKGGVQRELAGYISFPLIPITNFIKIILEKRADFFDLEESIMATLAQEKTTFRNLPQFFIFYLPHRIGSAVIGDQGLDISGFMESNQKAVYDLRAIGIHRGNEKGGHWFSLVHSKEGGLYVCDDSIITRINSWTNYKNKQPNDKAMIFLFTLKSEIVKGMKLAEQLNELRGSLNYLSRNLKPSTYD